MLNAPPRSLRWWYFDTAVAAVAAASSLPFFYRDEHQTYGPVVTTLIAVAMSAPLIFRRAAPIAVFSVIMFAIALAAFYHPGLFATPVALVAVYTVAAERSRTAAATAAATLACGLAVLDRIGGQGGLVERVLFFGCLVLAALGLGLYSSVNRAYVTSLVEGTRRLEQERERREELAAAAERDRIAREMHDIIAHHLTVIVSLSQGAAATFRSTPDAAAAAMGEITNSGRQALRDTRNLLGVLREPDAPDNAGDCPSRLLSPTPSLLEVDVLVDRVRAAGLPVVYQSSGQALDITPSVELAVYRVVQEALTNTLKHANKGAAATVKICSHDGHLRVEIDSTGCSDRTQGRPPPESGRGLAGMEQRVHAQGGTFDAGPTLTGWRVSASIPIESVQ